MSQIELELKGAKTVLVDPEQVTSLMPRWDVARGAYLTDAAYWSEQARTVLHTTTPWSEAVARIWLAKEGVSK